MANRRSFLQSIFGLGAGLIAAEPVLAASSPSAKPREAASAEQTQPASSIRVHTPDVEDLAFTRDGDVKVFHLVAEPVCRQISPWKTIDCWGFNGSSPGPTIQAVEGDRVRVTVENRLPESLSMHWHGFRVPLPMDGMPYISNKPIPPGGRFVFEFTLNQNGNYFYHAHGAMQEMMGLIGLFVLHPKVPYRPQVDHDFGIVLQEWAVLPNQSVPNTANMEFNWLTFNGKSAPSTTPLLVRQGSRVRIRFVNMGMDHHPIHLHGHLFYVTGNEGSRRPETMWEPGNTVLVGVAQAREIEFIADNPGDWMLHCHLPHHMMNNMMDLMGDRMMQTADETDQRALMQMQTLADTVGFEHVHHAPVAENANFVRGFPQDAFMDMAMDDANTVAKPENIGLAPHWSAMAMGMATLVRVLPSDRYDQLMALVRKGTLPPKPQPEDMTHMPGMQHPAE
jgi:FtsP/CotA-like multicopper oxidase with cupredoxin domain